MAVERGYMPKTRSATPALDRAGLVKYRPPLESASTA